MRLPLIVAFVVGCLAIASAVAFLPGRSDTTARDRPITAWPDGVTPQRIVAFGTSLSAGNAWPDRLARDLAACFGHKVAVQRVAQPGATTDWALDQVAQVVAHRPDLVLIEFAVNDADLRDGLSLDRARTRLNAMLDSLRRDLPEARIALMTMSPAYGVRGWLRPWLAQHYAQLGQIADARDLALIDLYPRWRAAGLQDAFPDGLHPTDRATRQIVDPVLRRMIARAAGRDC